MEIYLDHAATTYPFSEVRDVMNQVMEIDYGNPSSLHKKGIESEQYIRNARQIIANSLKVNTKEIIFTSGGTEANNMALLGVAMANKRKGKHIISTKIEHASVSEPLHFLEEEGFCVTYLSVDKNGQVDLDQLKESIQEQTILVSIMYVNNEIGCVQQVEKIAHILKQEGKDIIFHVDAIQAYGKYRIYPKRLGIDLLSVSAHKIHGPKGIGFLYIRDTVKIRPILYGGGQQRDLRSGTENVPAIAGFSKAVELIYQDHKEKLEQLYQLKKLFIEGVLSIEGTSVNGIQNLDIKETAPHIISVTIDQIRSEVLLHALEEKGIYVSSGSACASNHPQISNTLQAIGLKNASLDSTLRFSLSVYTTEQEITETLEVLKELIPFYRRYARR